MGIRLSAIKHHGKLTMLLFALLLTISSCQYGENVLCNRTPLYAKGFDIPNLIKILNPKDSFNLNDTLWMRIEAPTSFFAENKSCNLTGNEISLRPQIVTRYNGKNDEVIFGFYTIVPKIGRSRGSEFIDYYFEKNGESFVAEFGVILDESALNEIGSIDKTGEYPIRIGSVLDEGCTYDDDACAVGKKRHPYNRGFYINTSFQGGQKIWKINMRP